MRPQIAITLALTGLIGCRPEGRSAGLEVQAAVPEAEGLDSQRLAVLRESLAGLQTRALLIVRNGKTVLEWYGSGYDAESRRPLASLTKSLVGGLSLLVALEDGLVHLDDRASDLIPIWEADSLKRTITLRQLAAHTSGVEDAEEEGRDHGQLSGWKGAFWARNPDPFTIAVRDAPVVSSPGSQLVYSNPGYAAMGYALTAALRAGGGGDLRELLRTRVMEPLGIPDDAWSVGYGRSYEVDGLKLVATWGGANYTARAVARVGQLMLQRGEWEGRALIQARWIDTVLAVGSAPPDARPFRDAPTATLGWYSNANGAFPDVPRDAFLGAGAGQRVLVVIPSLGLVAVRLGLDMGSGFWSGIHRHFLTPLMEAVVEPPYPQSEVIRRVEFAPESTIVRGAVGSDNWPITWTRDGTQFAAYGDGWGFEPHSDTKLSLGFARIVSDPKHFTGVNVRSASGERTGNGPNGAKASGLLAVEGMLYMWARNLQNAQLAWSADEGTTWEWGVRFDTSFGAPTFLQFGPDYAGARDEYVYVYSHDGSSAYQAADGVILARVPKGRVRDRDAYEFFVRADDNGSPVWTRDLWRRGAVLRYPGHALRTDAVYHRGLKRYLLAMALDMDGAWAIFDAPEPWGPWTTAFHTLHWDLGRTHGYRLPSKWIQDDGSMALIVSGIDDSMHAYDAFSVRGMRLHSYDR